MHCKNLSIWFNHKFGHPICTAESRIAENHFRVWAEILSILLLMLGRIYSVETKRARDEVPQHKGTTVNYALWLRKQKKYWFSWAI